MKAQWKYVDGLPIHARMRDVVQQTIDVTRKQLDHDRKRLRKLKYGT